MNPSCNPADEDYNGYPRCRWCGETCDCKTRPCLGCSACHEYLDRLSESERDQYRASLDRVAVAFPVSTKPL